jgi:hypothetical protein
VRKTKLKKLDDPASFTLWCSDSFPGLFYCRELIFTNSTRKRDDIKQLIFPLSPLQTKNGIVLAAIYRLTNSVMMRMVGTRVHGLLDYLMGIALIGAPLLLNLAPDGPETWVPAVLGIIGIAYSLFTNYELSIWKIISVRTHLLLDLVAGIILCISPWLFGFSHLVWVPHLMLGIIVVCLSLVTKPRPSATYRDKRANPPVITSVIEP